MSWMRSKTYFHRHWPWCKSPFISTSIARYWIQSLNKRQPFKVDITPPANTWGLWKKVRDLSVTSLIRLWQHETPLSVKKLVIKGVLKALMAERAESSCERGKQLRDDKRWALWERRFIISISMRSFAASEFNSGYRWTPIWKQLPATCGVGWGRGTDPLEEAPAVQMNLRRARRTKCKNLLASMHRASAMLY